MKQMPSGCVDLVVTDPPFFMPATHYQSRVHWQRNYADLSPLKIFWDVMVDRLVKLLKRTGHLFVFSNCDSYPVFYEPTYNRFDKLKSIIWDKGRVGLGRLFRNQHELIIWARWETSRIKEDGKLRSDVLRFPATPPANRNHPVQKPDDLISELIEPTSQDNNFVLDPFLGSGTTCVVAERLNRKWIGIEISETYCKIAQKCIEVELEKKKQVEIF